MAQVFSFIDLLGFKERVNVDVDYALNMLSSYNSILGITINDQTINPISSYPPVLQELAQSSYVTTFKYFLPGSDSVFVSSEDDNINVFVKQLSSFLYKCFCFTAHFYDSPVSPRIKTYPPCLFRGGIAIGEVLHVSQSSVANSKYSNRDNMFGRPVVEAIALEGVVYGPRILARENVVTACDTDVRSHYFKKVDPSEYRNGFNESESLYELLWPVAGFIRDNGIDTEVTKLNDLVGNVYNLYKSPENSKVVEHYRAFAKLFFDSILCFWNNNEKAKRVVAKLQVRYPL